MYLWGLQIAKAITNGSVKIYVVVWKITHSHTKSSRPCREFHACNSPNDFDARRLYISTLDFRWTMRWVMAWYFRRKSFSEPVDSAESLLAPPAWGSSSSPQSPLLSSVKHEKCTPIIMFRKAQRRNTWFKIFWNIVLLERHDHVSECLMFSVPIKWSFGMYSTTLWQAQAIVGKKTSSRQEDDRQKICLNLWIIWQECLLATHCSTMTLFNLDK